MSRLLIETVDGRRHEYQYPNADAYAALFEAFKADPGRDRAVAVPGGYINLRHIVRVVGLEDKPPPPQPTAEPERTPPRPTLAQQLKDLFRPA